MSDEALMAKEVGDLDEMIGTLYDFSSHLMGEVGDVCLAEDINDAVSHLETAYGTLKYVLEDLRNEDSV